MIETAQITDNQTKVTATWAVERKVDDSYPREVSAEQLQQMKDTAHEQIKEALIRDDVASVESASLDLAEALNKEAVVEVTREEDLPQVIVAKLGDVELLMSPNCTDEEVQAIIDLHVNGEPKWKKLPTGESVKK